MGVRSEIYQILSECYKEPSIEFATDVAQGYLYRELSRHLTHLGIALSLEDLKIQGDAEEVLRVLKDQYYPLFVGPFPPFALPVESAYKEWARSGESPLIAPDVKGMLMGDPAVDMLRRYEASGIEIPKEFKEMPDHLALLLEYMSLLCEAGTEEEQERFVRDHLNWLPGLRRSMDECTKQRGEEGLFYRTVANATMTVIALERSLSRGEEFRGSSGETGFGLSPSKPSGEVPGEFQC